MHAHLYSTGWFLSLIHFMLESNYSALIIQHSDYLEMDL